MRLFWQRIPPETKVAAVVLGAALVQVGVLATVGLRGEDERRTELVAELRQRSRRTVERSVVNAGAARVTALEQSLQRDLETEDRPLMARVLGVLDRTDLYAHAFLLDLGRDGVPRLSEVRRPPLAIADQTPFDEKARRRVAGLMDRERSDSAGVVRACEAVADASDDRVASALALQAGWRAALRLSADQQALGLAERVLREHPNVVDNRGPSGESVPFGLGAAAAICDILQRAVQRDSDPDAGSFVDAVRHRRRLAQRLRWALTPDSYAFETAACRDLVDDVSIHLPPEAVRQLRAELDACAALDLAWDRASAVPASTLRGVAEGGEPDRLHAGLGADAIVLTVLPLPSAAAEGPGGPSAVAFMASAERWRDEVLAPARQGVDLPAGVTLVVRDRGGQTLVGPADGESDIMQISFRNVLPGLWAGVVVTDPSVLSAETESARRLWLWILVGAGLAVIAAALLALRAVLREVRLARLKSDFVSNLSHELRTPLTSLRMFVETLQEGRYRDDAERQQYLDIIARETNRLAVLVDRILQFAAFSRGRAPIELQSVDAGIVVRRALEIFRSRAMSADARIDVEIERHLPEVLLDRVAMIQVLLNLLDNAVKYGGDKGVRIRVSVRGVGSRVRFEVEDDGPGVPERERELVFEEFFRGDDSLSSSVQGTGIGLALCRRVALAHGGRIEVTEARTLGGACFELTLPDAAVGRRLALAAQEGRA